MHRDNQTAFEAVTQLEREDYARGYRDGSHARACISNGPAYDAGYREGVMARFQEVCRESDAAKQRRRRG